MNRGAQIGALALCLGGLLSELSGQETVWRSVPDQGPSVPPGSAACVRAAMGDSLGVSLGRPIARGVAAEESPRPFPDDYRSATPLTPQPPSWPGGVEPIATVPPPGAVIAAAGGVSTLTAPRPPESEDPPEQFASDRPAPPRLLPIPWAATSREAPEILQVANWTDRYPVDPPDPVAPPPPDALFLPGMQAAPPARFYAGAEYLLWWIRPDHAPPLVTTGDAQGGLNPAAGALGQPSTVILDNGNLTHNPMSGGRFWAGYFLDCAGCKAIEVSGFFLGPTSNNFAASSAQFPVLARPFFNLNQGMQATELTAFPGISSGNVRVSSPTNLYGLQPDILCKLCCGCDWRLNVLAGFLYLNLHEGVTITETIQFDPGVLPAPFNGTTATVMDSFNTRNQFYGGQVGLDGRWYLYGKFFVDGRATVALGDTHQTLNIAGSQTFPPGTPNVSSLPGGLLALNSNIGTYNRDVFSVVPEVRLALGYSFCDNVRLLVGYDFLYWSNVLRPGQQIDTNIDITRIPNFAAPPGTQPIPGAHPGVPFKESGFWAQGLTVGLEFIW
jgi:hypothetical protein